jgi:ATP-dependent protease HslVU (ClpYQ) peptidase subunit
LSATGEKHRKIGNSLLAGFAGAACFVFALTALILLEAPHQKILAALAIGACALICVRVASERTGSGHG